jgi:hypothetical protein
MALFKTERGDAPLPGTFYFEGIVKDRILMIENLLASKGKEYSTGDRFSNFKDAAGGLSFHNRPEMVAWEFATKHFQSIKDIISGKVPADQATIDEKFGDPIVYLLLMKGMMTEKNEKHTSTLDKVIYHLKENQ